MSQIENNRLKLNTKAAGAEITSLFDKQKKIEYIWQADAKVWGRHAPVLFPIVGRLKNDRYKHEGRTYKMGQHGFARDMNFKQLETGSSSVTYLLTDSEESRKLYPFSFEFSIEYKLVEQSLITTYRVKNTGNEAMPFSVGAHPGFNIAVHEGESIEDYFVAFPETKGWQSEVLASGLITGQKRDIGTEANRLPITKNVFDQDAIILNPYTEQKVLLANQSGSYQLDFDIAGWPYLGIWAKPGANYVCIEPWQGLADHINAGGQLEDKEGIVTLPSGQSREYRFTVSVK